MFVGAGESTKQILRMLWPSHVAAPSLTAEFIGSFYR